MPGATITRDGRRSSTEVRDIRHECQHCGVHTFPVLRFACHNCGAQDLVPVEMKPAGTQTAFWRPVSGRAGAPR